MTLAFLAFVVPAVADAQASAADTVVTPGISLVLRPERNDDGNVAAVGVTYYLTDTVSAVPTLEFRAPIVLNGIPGIGDRIARFRVDDEIGPVLLTREDDKSESGPVRRWRTARSVSFPVTVRYSAIVPSRRIRAGPPVDLRTFAGGVSGGGAGFLVLPHDGRQYRVRIRWDLRSLHEGSAGISSLGDGDTDTTMALTDLRSSWFMAGQLGRYPAGGNDSGFSAAWLGSSPAFDIHGDMTWAATAYRALSTFFGDTAQRPYRFFLRVLPESTVSGGAAGDHSFMLQVPVRPPRSSFSGGNGSDLRSIIAHELIHGWVGSIEGAGAWASEGFATYFTANLQRRLGLRPIRAFVAELNRLSREYHGSPYRNATDAAARVASRADENAESLPHVRAALYFFALDAVIRQVSDGAQSLDDILLDLFARRAAGEVVSVRSFIDALAKVLGPGIAREFDSVVIRGTRTVFVPPDAFGPCFTYSWTQVVVPDFAFDRRTPGVQTVVSLVPSSAAANAGLRNGDVITTPVSAEQLVSDEVQHMKLDVVRGKELLYLTYLTRPKINASWQWSRVPGVPLAVCHGARP